MLTTFGFGFVKILAVSGVRTVAVAVAAAGTEVVAAIFVDIDTMVVLGCSSLIRQQQRVTMYRTSELKWFC
jgi:DNA-binding IclR family transcriptional regulator